MNLGFGLEGQTALVTGAASGIGRRIAHGLAEAGASVACVDLSGSRLDSVVADIVHEGGKAIASSGDVTDPDTMRTAVEKAESELGPLSLAVNGAGIADAAPAEEMSLPQWRRVIDINVTGIFLSCQAEGRAMLAHGHGSIVNIASMSGTIVNRGLLQAHYNASKAAVIHLSKSFAMEWAAQGIRVNTLSPGYTATPMNSRAEVADKVQQFEADTPLGRMAAVEEMVGPAVFLLSDAASFVTGHDLVVDGGFTCW